MRPRFGPAIASRSARHYGRAKPLDASGGGVFAACCTITPTWNAIGLRLPVGLDARHAIGSLSPWHSVLPPRAHRRPALDAGGGEPCRGCRIRTGVFATSAIFIGPDRIELDSSALVAGI